MPAELILIGRTRVKRIQSIDLSLSANLLILDIRPIIPPIGLHTLPLLLLLLFALRTCLLPGMLSGVLVSCYERVYTELVQ